MVGLAFRAGKVLAGTAACEKGLKQRRICLLLLQDGLSGSTRNSFLEQCEKAGADVITINKIDLIGEAIGRSGIMVLGIIDKGFADAIRNNYDGGSGN